MHKLTARDKDVRLALSGLQFHEHASLNMSSSKDTSVSGKEFVKKCNGKNSPRTMLHLYSQITGAFQLSVITLQCLRKGRDLEIQNYLNDWGMRLS